MAHFAATEVQRGLGPLARTYGQHRAVGYMALRRGGFSPLEARRLIEDVVDPFFHNLGVNRSTVLRQVGGAR